MPADTGIGFAPSFRFGNPFFLQPNVDELVKRFQIKDNFSIVTGQPHHQDRRRVAAHQQRPGVPRLLHRDATCSTASPASCATRRRPAPGGFGPIRTVGCSNGTYVTAPAACPAGTTPTGGPLLFYLQSSSPDGIARDAAGASDITNEEFALFIQDKWQVRPRPDDRLRPALGRPADARDRRSGDHGVRGVPERPARSRPTARFPDQMKQFQPRVGFAWDVSAERQVGAARQRRASTTRARTC